MRKTYKGNELKLVVFDFEGVLCETHIGIKLAEPYGCAEKVKDLYAAAIVSDLPVNEAMERTFELFKGLDVDDVLRQARIPLLPNVESTVKKLKEEGYKLAILTLAVPDFVAEYYGDKLGFDYVFANKVELKNNKIVGLANPAYTKGSKGRVLRELAEKEGISLKQIVAVGDDPFNIPMFRAAGFSIAFAPRAAEREVKEVLRGRRGWKSLRARAFLKLAVFLTKLLSDVTVEERDLSRILPFLVE